MSGLFPSWSWGAPHILRRLRCALPLLGCAPLVAASPVSPWAGVWQGTVGKAEVRLCLQQGDQVSGAYYYARYLKLIALSEPERATVQGGPLLLKEMMPKAGRRASALWEEVDWLLQRSADGRVLEGSWRSPHRTLPVRLTLQAPVPPPAPGGEAAPQACESDAFNLPREVPAQVVGTELRLKGAGAGTAYRQLRLDFGGRNPSDIRSFELLREDEGARRFNAAQRQALMDDQRTRFECSRSVIGRFGSDGDYNAVTEPVLIGRQWLLLRQQISDDCGGAHPNAHMGYQLWHLGEARVQDPWAWFNPKGAVQTWHGEGANRYSTLTLGAPLRAALSQAWAKLWPPGEEDCRSVADEGGGPWSAHPTPQGMVFMPELPHVAYACTEEVLLPWARILPWLNATGQQAVASFRADMARLPAR